MNKRLLKKITEFFFLSNFCATTTLTNLNLCSVSRGDVGDGPTGFFLYRLFGTTQKIK